MQYSLEELRARNKKTQGEMAKKLKISRRTYIKIEQDPSNAKCKRMMEIADILGVSMNEIILLPANHTNSEGGDARGVWSILV